MNIPIFVINLDENVGRLDLLHSRLTKHGLKYERFRAINGREIAREFVKINYPQFIEPLRSGFSPGIVGCFISHVEVAKIIIERNLDSACILEDDAILANDFPLFIKKEDQYPAWAEAIKLETTVRRRFVLCSHVDRIHGRRIAYVPANCIGGSAAYILKRSGAEKVVNIVAKLKDDAIDHALFNFPKSTIKIAHVLPYPVRQSDAPSIISYPAKRKTRKTIRQTWDARSRKSKALLQELWAARKVIGAPNVLRLALADIR